MSEQLLIEGENKENVENDELCDNFDTICTTNIAVCSGIPAETQFEELWTFLSKYGQTRFLWLEKPNGGEIKQALVEFENNEGLKKLKSKNNALMK
ncbi:MAG: hypothetical protein EZS28_024192 [Streblomastix strix]|uniref:RRM domain-containing protein n=1 Tax=Streblomastix strix TaxID=222440 RepID=A0A5J4VCS6_9EUKA|nr:MAG: hypothetical protein EZS28_024192 [Streblomastix strix]